MSTAEIEVITPAIGYRDYPEELKASVIAAIKANGGNVLATAKLFNIPRDTVNYWWRKQERFAQIEQTSSINLADKLEYIAHSQADSIAEQDLSQVSIRDKAAVLGVCIEKMQLLRGQPTSINVDVNLTDLGTMLAGALTDAIDATTTDGIDHD